MPHVDSAIEETSFFPADSREILWEGAERESEEVVDEEVDLRSLKIPVWWRVFMWILGVICVTLAIIIWITTAELLQTIFIDFECKKPYMTTYFSCSLFVFYLFGYVTPSWRRRLLASYTRNILGQDDEANQHVGYLKMFWLVLIFTPIWLTANYLDILSLSFTSVASNSVITSTSGVFAAILSMIFFLRRLNPIEGTLNFISAILSLIGVILVTISASPNDSVYTPNPLFGNILVFLSAIAYSCYAVFAKKVFERMEGKNVNVMEFFGYFGLLSTFALLPGFPILHVLGIEEFEIPSFTNIVALVVYSFLSSFIADILFSISAALTTPVLSAVGLSLGIPLSILLDYVIRGEESQLGPLYLTGSALAGLGFLLVNIPSDVMYYWQKRKFITLMKWIMSRIRKSSEENEEYLVGLPEY